MRMSDLMVRLHRYMAIDLRVTPLGARSMVYMKSSGGGWLWMMTSHQDRNWMGGLEGAANR